MGKVKIKLGYIYINCDSVKRGEGLTKAYIFNGTFELEFEHFQEKEEGVGKSQTT